MGAVPVLTCPVPPQEAEIDSIHQLVVGATENIKEGNEDIREVGALWAPSLPRSDPESGGSVCVGRACSADPCRGPDSPSPSLPGPGLRTHRAAVAGPLQGSVYALRKGLTRSLDSGVVGPPPRSPRHVAEATIASCWVAFFPE